MEGRLGHLSLLAGAFLPTGENDQRLSNGEKLEPSSQPGSGAFSYQAGIGYSHHLTRSLTLDVSELYTLRTGNDGFEMGDRVDGGMAIAYKFDDVADSHSSPVVFLELTHNWIGKDSDAKDGLNANSGGTSYYLTSGLRYRLTHNVSLTAAPSIPLRQHLNGEQLETDFRVLAQLSVTV